MVILPAGPTRWTAGAFHPCWDIPNRVRSEGGTFAFNGTYAPSDLSELNPLATHAPWGLMQRQSPLHECGGADMPPHSWAWQTMPTERTRDREAFPICITFVQQQNKEQ